MMKEAAISPGQVLAYSVKNFWRPTGIVSDCSRSEV
jgi:hypothetical protein